MRDYRKYRFLSFNIKNNYAESGRHVWEKRRQGVSGVLKFHQITAAGLQEALIDQIQDLQEKLPGYGWLGAGRDDGQKQGEFNPIFYHKECLKVKQNDTFWLSENPSVPGQKGWDAVCSRIVTWANFEDQKTGEKFYFFNTHFDHVGTEAQRESAYLLKSKIKKISEGGPVIVSGDFNVPPENRVYKIMVGRDSVNLQDSRMISRDHSHGPDSTFHGFEGLDENPQKDRIDYIFVNDHVQVLKEGVLTDRRENGYISDHYPVLAEIIFDRPSCEK